VSPTGLPSFDLIVATVGRTAELETLLASLQRQTYDGFRVLVADQNADDRLAELLAGRKPSVVHLRAERGLARARNTALGAVEADVVGFPDDDCTYPADLLERVARTLEQRPELDGITGRTEDAHGRTAPGWPKASRMLDREHVWHGGNSTTTFLRAGLVRRVGAFDEALGLGAGTPWASGEDTDYLVRALDLGARIEYDPSLVVIHDRRAEGDLAAAGAREGAAVGYLLGKHRYPPRTLGRMLVRPLGGVVASLVRLDGGRARFHALTLRGRARGYLAGRKA
jgi:GT2 family glycosyltransferase